MKTLVLALPPDRPVLEAQLAADFALEWHEDAASVCASVDREPADALVIHLGIGEEPALDVLSHCRRLPPDRKPGIVAVVREVVLRVVVELVRTGAYDVLLEGELKPRELPHAIRNASYFVKSAAWIAKRQAQADKGERGAQ